MKYLVVLILSFILSTSLVSAMSATVNIPEEFSEVNAGERVYFETEIKWPSNDRRQDLRIEYSIRGNDDEEIAYLQVLKAIETQASFMEFVNIPESTQEGVYRVYLTITDYEDMEKEIAASFNVRRSSNNKIYTYFLVILGVLALIAIIVSTELFVLIKKQEDN